MGFSIWISCFHTWQDEMFSDQEVTLDEILNIVPGIPIQQAEVIFSNAVIKEEREEEAGLDMGDLLDGVDGLDDCANKLDSIHRRIVDSQGGGSVELSQEGEGPP